MPRYIGKFEVIKPQSEDYLPLTFQLSLGGVVGTIIAVIVYGALTLLWYLD